MSPPATGLPGDRRPLPADAAAIPGVSGVSGVPDVPGVPPGVTAGIDPNVSPNVSPDIDPEISPNVSPYTPPDIGPRLSPGLSPGVSPNVEHLVDTVRAEAFLTAGRRRDHQLTAPFDLGESHTVLSVRSAERHHLRHLSLPYPRRRRPLAYRFLA